MTSPDVNASDSLATLRAALDAGVNFFDTAYGYGKDGESERLIARALGERRGEIAIILVELIGMDQENLVEASCLPDLKAFAKATGNDKLRSHTLELIESLENAGGG